MSAAVAVGPPVVGYCEEERGGGLGDGGVDNRASVLSLSLSPSRTLHTYGSAHRRAMAWLECRWHTDRPLRCHRLLFVSVSPH